MSISKQAAYIVSLGCPRNLVDSELILGSLDKKKYKIVSSLSKADTAIVNTCSFIEDAKKESIGVILDLIELKKKRKLKKIIVSGCLLERYGSSLQKEFKEIDEFIPRIWPSRNNKRVSLTLKHTGYLKISEGCRNNCSYCAIALIKGSLKSLTPKEVLREVEYFDKKGVSELNIVGQDISSYGLDLDEKINLAALLKLILKKSKNIKWIRLLYLHPKYIDDELIQLIKNEKRICKYLDLPIQHINDRILKLMNRPVTKKQISYLIGKLRNEIKGLTIRTTVIVGFPGERDKEFNELLDFVEKIKFERLGAFIYSREEQTKAYHFSDQVLPLVKRKRYDILMNKQKEISLNLNKSLIGITREVLIEDKFKNGYFARAQSDAPEIDNQVIINTDKKLKIGSFVNVRIVDAFEYDLVGELL